MAVERELLCAFDGNFYFSLQDNEYLQRASGVSSQCGVWIAKASMKQGPSSKMILLKSVRNPRRSFSFFTFYWSTKWWHQPRFEWKGINEKRVKVGVFINSLFFLSSFSFLVLNIELRIFTLNWSNALQFFLVSFYLDVSFVSMFHLEAVFG